MRLFKFVFLLIFATLLPSCSSTQGTVMQGVRLAISGPPSSLQAVALNPKFIYLEVHSKGVGVLMPLAYEDVPGKTLPPIDTWISAGGEILRTQAGFLASSAALADYWTNVAYQFDGQGKPVSVRFDVPSKQLFDVVLNLQNLGQVEGNYTPLMKRAAKLPSVQFYAWQGQLAPNDVKATFVKTALKLGSNKALNFVIGVDSKTGVPIYGLHCVQTDQCVEYLLRTVQQDL